MNSTSTSSDNFKESLKQQADIVRIVGDYVKLKKAGAQNFSGLCPFHAEKTPSFLGARHAAVFHCFGCGQSGDVFTFIQKVENITFRGCPAHCSKAGRADAEGDVLESGRGSRRSGFAWRCSTCMSARPVFPGVSASSRRRDAPRIPKGRGLDTKPSPVSAIGYAPDSGFLLRDALRREFGEELLRESGYFSWKESPQPLAVSPQGEQVTENREPRTENSQANDEQRAAEQRGPQASS